MKYMDKGWKSLSDVWKKANVCWHMGAPLKQSTIVVIASVKTVSGWKSVAIGLTDDSHNKTFDAALCKNREIVKCYAPSQVTRLAVSLLLYILKPYSCFNRNRSLML